MDPEALVVFGHLYHGAPAGTLPSCDAVVANAFGHHAAERLAGGGQPTLARCVEVEVYGADLLRLVPRQLQPLRRSDVRVGANPHVGSLAHAGVAVRNLIAPVKR